MKELFRFVSVEKFNGIQEPVGKININDVIDLTQLYSKAIHAKDKTELDTVIESFFVDNVFNPCPLDVSNNITSIYCAIKDNTKIDKEFMNELCNKITGKSLPSLIESDEYKKAKAIIIENLFFLTHEKNKRHSKIKIIYKHLLKLIGLLEAINNKYKHVDKILLNPSLQYYRFDFQNYYQDIYDNNKNEEEINKFKEGLITKYDEILNLKNSQKEVLKLHRKNKNDVSRSKLIVKEKSTKKAGFFENLFGVSRSTEGSEIEAAEKNINPLLIKAENLSDQTLTTLKSIGIDDSNMNVYGTLNSIDDEIIKKSNQLNSSLTQPRYFSYAGNLLSAGRNPNIAIEISDALKARFIDLVNGLNDNDVPSSLPRAPIGHGFARVLGEGCLQRVEETYIGCKLTNIASVTNIPAKSKKSYEDRNLSKSVSTIESESEDIAFVETSSDTIIKTNLSDEIGKEQKFDMSLEAGLNISASYGPVLVEGSSKFITNLSSSELKKSASSYARDVTQRAINRMENRSRKFVKQEVTIENEVTNLEEYDNDANNHVIGIHQWINEVYKAKLVQYDARLLLEFMVPEPGAVLLYASSTPYSSKEDETPTPPIPFNIGIDDIKLENYKQLIKNWSAVEVAPPPPQVVVISKTIAGPEKGGEGDNRVPVHIKQCDESLSIPDGYNVDYIFGDFGCTRAYNKDGDKDTSTHHYDIFQISIGKNFVEISDSERGKYFEFNYDESVHWINIPVAITGFQARTFVLNISAYCIRTQQAIDSWKIETFSKLKQAHQKQLDEYNDKISLTKQRSFIYGALGSNAEKNRKIEKEELKRSCISILTNQSFELFDGINDPPGRIPTIKFDQIKSEGDYSRFFETAFEWTQIVYVLYPYFWANPDKTWLRSLNLKLDDPKHEEFLKSGVARVVVPVRPEFQLAILEYLHNGVLWDGEDPDDIDWEHSMYVEPAIEIMERQGELRQDPITKDEWEYELPTNHRVITNGTNLPTPPFL